MQVDDARRYSRSEGLSTCESVYGTPGRWRSSSAPTRRSCAGFTIDQSRQTPTASISWRPSASMIPTTALSSSASVTLPS